MFTLVGVRIKDEFWEREIEDFLFESIYLLHFADSLSDSLFSSSKFSLNLSIELFRIFCTLSLINFLYKIP